MMSGLHYLTCLRRIHFLTTSQFHKRWPTIKDNRILGSEPKEMMQTFWSNEVIHPSHKNKQKVHFGYILVCNGSVSAKSKGKIVISFLFCRHEIAIDTQISLSLNQLLATFGATGDCVALWLKVVSTAKNLMQATYQLTLVLILFKFLFSCMSYTSVWHARGAVGART